jgi:hypothetical protein
VLPFDDLLEASHCARDLDILAQSPGKVPRPRERAVLRRDWSDTGETGRPGGLFSVFSLFRNFFPATTILSRHPPYRGETAFPLRMTAMQPGQLYLRFVGRLVRLWRSRKRNTDPHRLQNAFGVNDAFSSAKRQLKDEKYLIASTAKYLSSPG